MTINNPTLRTFRFLLYFLLIVKFWVSRSICIKDGNNMELPEVNKPKDYHLPVEVTTRLQIKLGHD